MKKTIALLLMLCLTIGLLAGCNSSKPAETPAQTETPAKTEEPTKTETPTGDVRCGIANQPLATTGAKLADDNRSEFVWTWDQHEDINYVSLPCSDKLETITAFTSIRAMGVNYVDDPNEANNMQELERRTNVHVDWTTVSAAALAEQFSLMITSGDWMDIIFGSDAYTGGVTAGVQDDVFMELTDLMNKYMPNFQAILDRSDEYRRLTLNNDGQICAIGQYEYTREPDWYGVNIATDIVEKIGGKTPVTLKDWEDLMDLAKSEYGMPYGYCPMPISSRAQNIFPVFSAYDTFGNFYQVDGKIHFGPVEDAFRDGLKKMNEWYNKGYLGDEWYAAPDQTTYYANMGNAFGAEQYILMDGMSGYFHDWLTRYGSTKADVYTGAVANPVLEEGNEIHFAQIVPLNRQSNASIATSAKNPELCAKWMDYRLSYEGKTLWNYGVEGVDWEMNPDGTVTLSETGYKATLSTADDYATWAEKQQKSVWSVASGGWYEWRGGRKYWVPGLNEENVALGNIWADSAPNSWMLPTFDVKTEYLAQGYASKLNDIWTYIEPMYIKFIIGEVDIDAEWDTYVKGIWAMGLQDCIDAQQDSLDAYNAR